MNTKTRLYRAVAELVEADATGDENFKEFWESCETNDEVRQARALLFELAAELRERSEKAREVHLEGA